MLNLWFWQPYRLDSKCWIQLGSPLLTFFSSSTIPSKTPTCHNVEKKCDLLTYYQTNSNMSNIPTKWIHKKFSQLKLTECLMFTSVALIIDGHVTNIVKSVTYLLWDKLSHLHTDKVNHREDFCAETNGMYNVYIGGALNWFT